MTSSHEHVLRDGQTCWRIVTADRAAVLIDGAAYFSALRQAMLQAQRSILIVGWDIHSEMKLVGAGKKQDPAPEALRDFLIYLTQNRPELNISLLLWDYSLLYSLEREPAPSLKMNWTTPPEISIRLDNALPFSASHHQKIVVIDDSVAFSGGVDLTVNRWDTPAHDIDDPNRVDPSGNPYPPFHDIQMVVDGDAARALGSLARQRWLTAGGASAAEPPPDTSQTDCWPKDVEPDFISPEIGIARTMAAYGDAAEIHEVELLFLAAIKVAERTIYCENQFFTAHKIGVALADRLAENPKLEVVLVGPKIHHSWLEERAMNTGRYLFMKHFEERNVADRVKLYHPAIAGDDTTEGVMVHAKLMIVDDRLLRIGSANLNNRSMRLDTECDLAIEARNSAERAAITALKTRLLSEHLDKPASAVTATLRRESSFIAAVESLCDGERALRPIDLSETPNDGMAVAVHSLADPEKPVKSTRLLTNILTGNLPGARDED